MIKYNEMKFGIPRERKFGRTRIVANAMPEEIISAGIIAEIANSLPDRFTYSQVVSKFLSRGYENYYRAGDRLLKRMKKNGEIKYIPKEKMWIRLNKSIDNQ